MGQILPADWTDRVEPIRIEILLTALEIMILDSQLDIWTELLSRITKQMEDSTTVVTLHQFLDIGADVVVVAAAVVEAVAADVDVDFRFHFTTALFNFIDVSFVKNIYSS